MLTQHKLFLHYINAT